MSDSIDSLFNLLEYDKMKTRIAELEAENASLTDQLADADRVSELVKARHAELAEKLAAVEKEIEAAPELRATESAGLHLWVTNHPEGPVRSTHTARLVRIERLPSISTPSPTDP